MNNHPHDEELIGKAPQVETPHTDFLFGLSMLVAAGIVVFLIVTFRQVWL